MLEKEVEPVGDKGGDRKSEETKNQSSATTLVKPKRGRGADYWLARLARRNLLKGQKAIALAMIFPNDGQKGRGKKDEGKEMARKSSFSHDRLRQARQILRYSRPLAESVRDGEMQSFNSYSLRSAGV